MGHEDQEKRPEDQPISVSVITAVASEEGVSPTDLTPPLGDVVDPALLDRFFDAVASGTLSLDGTISFTYREHEVVVDGTGQVSVDPADRDR